MPAPLGTLCIQVIECKNNWERETHLTSLRCTHLELASRPLELRSFNSACAGRLSSGGFWKDSSPRSLLLPTAQPGAHLLAKQRTPAGATPRHSSHSLVSGPDCAVEAQPQQSRAFPACPPRAPDRAMGVRPQQPTTSWRACRAQSLGELNLCTWNKERRQGEESVQVRATYVAVMLTPLSLQLQRIRQPLCP